MLNHFNALDLSHTLHSEMASWNGRCGFEMSLKSDYNKGVRIYSYKCHAGIGSHMDAPSHFFNGTANIDDIPLESCIAPLICLSLKSQAKADSFLSLKMLQDFENKYDIDFHSSIFIYNSLWHKHWFNPSSYRNADANGKMLFPGISKECAEYLVQKGIYGIGIDTLSPDGSCESFPVHETLLSRGCYILENLCNLEGIPEKGAYLFTPPIKIKEATESFVRPIALIPKKLP